MPSNLNGYSGLSVSKPRSKARLGVPANKLSKFFKQVRSARRATARCASSQRAAAAAYTIAARGPTRPTPQHPAPPPSPSGLVGSPRPFRAVRLHMHQRHGGSLGPAVTIGVPTSLRARHGFDSDGLLPAGNGHYYLRPAEQGGHGPIWKHPA